MFALIGDQVTIRPQMLLQFLAKGFQSTQRILLPVAVVSVRITEVVLVKLVYRG